MFLFNYFFFLILDNSKNEPITDINSNEDESNQRYRSKSRDSSNSQASVKRERHPYSSGDDDREDGELDDEIDDELDEENDNSDKKSESTQKSSQNREENDENLNIDENDLKSDDGDDLKRRHDDDSDGRHSSEDRIRRRRRSSSDPVNLSINVRGSEDSDGDAHIDVESIGTAPSKVSLYNQSVHIFFYLNIFIFSSESFTYTIIRSI